MQKIDTPLGTVEIVVGTNGMSIIEVVEMPNKIVNGMTIQIRMS